MSNNKQSRMTREEVISMGFEPIPHFTITDSLIYDLGRNRHLSIGDIGMPNEMVFICEVNNENKNRVDEIIVLHNYDYDGYLTKERLQQFMVLKHNNEQQFWFIIWKIIGKFVSLLYGYETNE